MADRTHLRAAANNDIADDDPFAELTRIMGFDPRQPVRPQTPTQPKAAGAGQPADEGDFDIDLEKELMGEFGADDNDRAAEVREPAFEAADPMNAELAASLEQDLLLDDDATDEAAHGVSADDIDLAAELSTPAVDAAFDHDFEDAIASSLEDVSPFEDDLDDELADNKLADDDLAASLEQDFLLDDDVTDEPGAVAAEALVATAQPDFDDEFGSAIASSLEDELMLDAHVPPEQQATAAGVSAPSAEPDFDDEFDNAVLSSLEDELMLDEHVPMEQAAVEASVAPVQAVSDEADEDFAGHFDEAMADVDMDFDVRADESAEIDQPEIDEPEVAADELSAATSKGAFDDDFDLNFDDALVDDVEEPVAQVASV
ncbi:sporulation protein, partial [Mesorhizobium sanjuanii]